MSEVKKIFNDYDSMGYRASITGNRSHYIEDNAIVYNLRFRWKKELQEYSDVGLVNAYDEFAILDMYGDNDERFLEFVAAYFAE